MTSISFIVPVYNTSSTLARCLDSIIQQNLTDIEIIVINDGSLDDVDTIMSQYFLPYIRYIKQSNKGISATRNYGIHLARGEYLMFIDSDDYLVDKCIIELLIQARQFQLQLIRGNFINIYLNGRQDSNQYFINTFHAVVSGQSYYVSEVLAHRENMKNMPWMWLFNRQFLVDNQIYFDEKTNLLEDVLFIAQCCQYAERVSAVNLEIYYYVQHPQSSTNSMALTSASRQILYVSEQLYHQSQQAEGDFQRALKLYSGYVAIFALKIHRSQAYQQQDILAYLVKQACLFEADSQFRQYLVKASPYLFSQYLWGLEYRQRLIKKMKRWVLGHDN